MVEEFHSRRKSSKDTDSSAIRVLLEKVMNNVCVLTREVGVGRHYLSIHHAVDVLLGLN